MTNVLTWLDEAAERTPDKLAVSDIETSLTYAQLRDASASVGSWLIGRGMRPRQAVALFLDNSAPALAGMLGAVRAGGFYSVIDTRQPASRVLAICEALAPFVVLSDAASIEAVREMLAGTPREVVPLEEALAAEALPAELAAVRSQALDIDPLYVNFTSGSTGTPKGVIINHRCVIDFIGQFCETFGIGEDDRFANQAPFDFDVSVKDIYSALSVGATVHVIPRAFFSEPTKLMDFLCEREVTTLVWAVSALCFVSIMNGLDYRVPETVRRVIFSGEVMPPKQLRIWQRALPDAMFVNVYGPTEITCNCTYYIVEREYADDEVIPMGRTFPNERVMLLDEDDREVVEPGCEGEICVSGTSVGLGYLGDADRTAEAFVQNPLNGLWLETIYRTGDLAHYDDNGNLVYDSRKDHQIKHLGHRIELGEIEACSQAADGVDRACCLYDARRKKLLLFYVGALDKSELASHLRERLPQYMVPGKMRQIEAMPLTKNGKIDRKALAEL